VRKFSAILLIGIFALSQYARQISYLQCNLINSFKQPDQLCDCAKQAGFEKQTDEQAPAHKAHFHVRADEIFSFTEETELKIFLPVSKQLFSAYLKIECDGHHPSPWQPPNS